MSGSSRGGHKAARPPAGWQPPERLVSDGGGTAVRFLAQSGDAERIFDFSDIRDRHGERVVIEVGIQEWLARAFARRTSPRSDITRLAGAQGVYASAKRLAQFLTTLEPAPRGPAEITPAHMRGLWEFCGRTRAHRSYLEGLRSLLRTDSELPVASREVLFAQRLPDDDGREPVRAYTSEEMQLIMTRIRQDVRRARDRIRVGQALLARYRRGELADGGSDAQVGRLLDHFERTGDLPRYGNGALTRASARWGGARGIGLRLCLTSHEMTAFCLLLTVLTTENFGTVATWPAVHLCPDGGRDTSGPVLVEAVKPRRGPDREHMVTPLEDLPPGLGDLLHPDDDASPLFRSPARVYRLLLELTEVSRRHGRHVLALSGFTPMRQRGERRWPQGVGAAQIGKWAAQHGFRTGEAAEGGPPAVEARRLRQTGIEHHRRPTAHTRQVMNDRYLKRSPTVQAQSRGVVGDALRGEVAKARARRSVPVLPTALVAKARTDLAAAAAEVDLSAETLCLMIEGGQDTVATACTDPLGGAQTSPGRPCSASFFICLGCENARALPHHLPIQLALHDRLAALRPHVDPPLWRVRYQQPWEQLRDIVGHYSEAERSRAREQLSARQQRLVDDLVEGRLDLR